jgi:hypothetical protein
VIIPAWQKRQPRVQPRNTSTLRAVVDDLGQRDELALRVRPLAQVGDRALVDDRRHVGKSGRHGAQEGAVVADVVQRRHVDPGHLDQVAKHQAAVGAPGSDPPADDIGDLADHLLAITQHDHVDEVGQRLMVERAVAADHDQRVLGPTVRRPDGHAGEVDHLQDVGVDELSGEVEGEQVEVVGGAVGVGREQRDAVPAEQPVEVPPRCVRAFGERVGPLVEDLVEDLQPLVGQPDLVGVGIGEQPRHPARPVAGGDRAVLAADVTSRLLHLSEERFDPRPERGHDRSSVAGPCFCSWIGPFRGRSDCKNTGFTSFFACGRSAPDRAGRTRL